MQYQEIKDYSGKVSCIKRFDGAIIPLDPDNTDYQDYLAWLAEGNTPQEADE